MLHELVLEAWRIGLLARSLHSLPQPSLQPPPVCLDCEASRLQVPVDGQVVHGRSLVSMEHITGEALPAARGPGEELPAGARNHDGVLVLRALQAPDDSTPARIARLTLAAQASPLASPTLAPAAAALRPPLLCTPVTYGVDCTFSSTMLLAHFLSSAHWPWHHCASSTAKSEARLSQSAHLLQHHACSSMLASQPCAAMRFCRHLCVLIGGHVHQTILTSSESWVSAAEHTAAAKQVAGQFWSCLLKGCTGRYSSDAPAAAPLWRAFAGHCRAAGGFLSCHGRADSGLPLRPGGGSLCLYCCNCLHLLQVSQLQCQLVYLMVT